MQLLVATRNWQKFREIKEGLRGIASIELNSLHHYPSCHLAECLEEKQVERVTQQAENLSKKLACWVLLEESSLSIPKLSELESWTEPLHDSEDSLEDFQRRHNVLKAMQGLEGYTRAARYESVIALASPNGIKKLARASVEGTIADEERGSQGFGFDAIFQKFDYDKTLAELSLPVKLQATHRAKALEKILMVLEGIQ